MLAAPSLKHGGQKQIFHHWQSYRRLKFPKLYNFFALLCSDFLAVWIVTSGKVLMWMLRRRCRLEDSETVWTCRSVNRIIEEKEKTWTDFHLKLGISLLKALFYSISMIMLLCWIPIYNSKEFSEVFRIAIAFFSFTIFKASISKQYFVQPQIQITSFISFEKKNL